MRPARLRRRGPHRLLAPNKKALLCSAFLFGGGSWIRTSEVSDNRFTVCPLWPLGNSPKSMELVIGVEPTTCWLQISCSAIEPHQHHRTHYIIADTNPFVNTFLKKYFHFIEKPFKTIDKPPVLWYHLKADHGWVRFIWSITAASGVLPV